MTNMANVEKVSVSEFDSWRRTVQQYCTNRTRSFSDWRFELEVTWRN
jgi:hypothetical protein